MGYSTDFFGAFTLNKKLDNETKEFLIKFNRTRRMARNVDPKYGIQGEFYVDGKGMAGQDHEENIINYNTPPSTQPGLWCQWRPTDDGKGIEWDGGEKFYNYVEWLQYLIDKILAPKGYVLTGDVEYRGEESDDMGVISVNKNKIVVTEYSEYREMIENILKKKEVLPVLVGINKSLDNLIDARLRKS